MDTPTARTTPTLDAQILGALAHFGDATEGQVAAWIQRGTADVSAALSRMFGEGKVDRLPLSRTWTLAG